MEDEDISEDDEDPKVEQKMINLFIRLEVQRRYYSICGFEMLSKSFGMKEPSSLEALVSRKCVIPIERLISNGRGLTID